MVVVCGLMTRGRGSRLGEVERRGEGGGEGGGGRERGRGCGGGCSTTRSVGGLLSGWLKRASCSRRGRTRGKREEEATESVSIQLRRGLDSVHRPASALRHSSILQLRAAPLSLPREHRQRASPAESHSPRPSRTSAVGRVQPGSSPPACARVRACCPLRAHHCDPRATVPHHKSDESQKRRAVARPTRGRRGARERGGRERTLGASRGGRDLGARLEGRVEGLERVLVERGLATGDESGERVAQLEAFVLGVEAGRAGAGSVARRVSSALVQELGAQVRV